jgi:hypothetical protein
MAVKRRIYISVPGDGNLSAPQLTLKWAVIDKIKDEGYVPEMFYSERPNVDSLTHGENWGFAECSRFMRLCVGAVIIGLPRLQFPSPGGAIRLPTGYAHIEGTLAVEGPGFRLGL